MPARRGSPRGGRVPPFKPATQWESLQQSAEVVVAAGTKVLVGSFFTDEPTTIRRTRGLISWRSDQNAADELPMGAFGMVVVSDIAFAAGAASIPGPFTDADSDLWFVHQYVFAPMSISGAGPLRDAVVRPYEIDSKAMRKFTEEERVVLMWENGHATHGALSLTMLRVLASVSRS